MTIAVLAEKPSMARDIARAMGASSRRQGFLEGGGFRITWALGHLVDLAEPHQMRPEWKAWRRDTLPMLPRNWPLVVAERSRNQLEVVRDVLCASDIQEVVCATDAGREGELIFRTIYEAIGCDKPIRRLWISSLTDEAIQRGFARLRSGQEMEALADAARGRRYADWLVGMNLSRAVSLASDETSTVGRVQTPTLAMIAARELEIQSFVPEDYLEVEGTFCVQDEGDGRSANPANSDSHSDEAAAADSATGKATGDQPGSYRGVWFRSGPEKHNAAEDQPAKDPDKRAQARRLDASGEEARRIVERVKSGLAEVESVRFEQRRQPPPLLYDLTELQRHANRLYGFSAQKTLALAQSLYEQKKLISYPRTDSRHLSTDVAQTLDQVVQAIREPYEAHVAPGSGDKPLGRRFVDDRQVTDHHAILPTARRAAAGSLSADEAKIYDLVCRRLLCAWHQEHRWAVTRVVTRVTSQAEPSDDAAPASESEQTSSVVDRFASRGSTVQQMGWKVLEPVSARGTKGGAGRTDGKKGNPTDQDLPTGLRSGTALEVLDARTLNKQTRPPKRFTEATLLTAMETAGKVLDDKELSAAMRERGLGTPATRAEIIENLLRRGYLERQRKSLHATDKGLRLIERVHEQLKSPALTGEWEAHLKRVERGKAKLDDFLSETERFVTDMVTLALQGEPAVSSETELHARSPTTSHARSGNADSRQSNPGPSEAAPHADLDPGSDPELASLFALAPAEEPGAGEPLLPEPLVVASTAPGPPAPPTLPLTSPTRARTAPTVARSSAEAKGGPGGARLGAEQSAGTIHSTPRNVPWAQPTPAHRLGELLQHPFGHGAFRPYQEAVCRAVVEGQDVLLVMPTGAGKSLCYQLPGLARAGTTVVVSPLIALMEDQVEKLRQIGVHAERIHSGRERSASRQVCRDYLAGRLDFLFIAPERLAVSGFPELLAKRPPALIAVDEAHCISHWGHDFRPEYRMLGERLPALRPAPVIALTATATPTVQQDIARQLGMPGAERFIHGFRRTNIAVEVAELRPSQRRAAVAKVLADSERRPAIVYAPTRKEADALGEELAQKLPAAAYHAGMTTGARDRVQSAFLSGRLEVIVATIAFGMGVDKADVRTVIHTGLPGSLEGYYQEIGRAGRDGLPSRAVLLYSWADRRTHEFFHQRDYPEVSVLRRIAGSLGPRWQRREEVEARTGLEPEIFERAVEKLWIHGGAQVDPAENLAQGRAGWERDYEAQRSHKLGQLDDMARFAQSRSCRMLHLVQHFGDQEDSGLACGHCDLCAPEGCTVRKFRPPQKAELAVLEKVLERLRERDGQSTGQLFRHTGESAGQDRRSFERLLGGLARADLITVADDAFEKNGRVIHFQRASLTADGYRGVEHLGARVQLAEEPAAAPNKRSSKRPAKRGGRSTTRSTTKASARASKAAASIELDATATELVAALKAWRLKEARRRRIPAFRVLRDRVIHELAMQRPSTPEQLLEVSGIGPVLVKKYGEEFLRIVGAGS